jgi:hypothetical protein
LIIYTQGPVGNPGAAAAIAILVSVVVGVGIHYLGRRKRTIEVD